MGLKRYQDFNSFLRRHFGFRVHKISIDAGFTCPNRDGTISYGGCIYCDPEGSGTGAWRTGQAISDQITLGKRRLSKRYKAQKFLAYFQAFTNTYAPCEVLKRYYDEALNDPDIVGLCIGTRPDCVDEAKLQLIQNYTSKYMVWIEYGLQSIHNNTLRSINRGHTFEDFASAVRLTQGRSIYICAHVILGLPGETREDMLETAVALGDLGIDGVKIHSLYVVKDTPLATTHKSGAYQALTQQAYVELVVDFLELLPPRVVIQRLTGDPNPARLVGPDWSLKKQMTLELIEKRLEARDTYQGKLYATTLDKA
nr:TIGR01212 family radical SAM protein [Desulfobacterales bacterium]